MEFSSATLFYSTKNKKYVKGYRVFSFVRKFKKELLDTGLGSLKTPFKEIDNKTGKFLRNKVPNAVTTRTMAIVKAKIFEGIIIPPEKTEEKEKKY